jgi:hypothetical protein
MIHCEGGILLPRDYDLESGDLFLHRILSVHASPRISCRLLTPSYSLLFILDRGEPTLQTTLYQGPSAFRVRYHILFEFDVCTY